MNWLAISSTLTKQVLSKNDEEVPILRYPIPQSAPLPRTDQHHVLDDELVLGGVLVTDALNEGTDPDLHHVLDNERVLGSVPATKSMDYNFDSARDSEHCPQTLNLSTRMTQSTLWT
jgi:hypothetical protein